MENVFRILAAILGGIAAYFLWVGNGDGAFIAVVAGAVAFFFSIRVQVKRRLNERDREIIAQQDREALELEAAEKNVAVDRETSDLKGETLER